MNRSLFLLCVFVSSVVGCGEPAPEASRTAPADTSVTDAPGNVGQDVDVVGENNRADRQPAKQSAVTLVGNFPPLAPLPELPVPGDNPISDAKTELGKLLFWDDRLSGDVGTSCASCHDPRLGWGDGNALSRGYAGTQHWRNSQTTINTAYLAKLFWAGETPSLESQANSAITGNLAGNGDPVMIEERLAQIPEYVQRFHEAFGGDRPLYDHVLKAIATFERVAMDSRDSPLDQYLAGDESALSEEALRGKVLFEGKAGCIKCHNGALTTDEKFHNLGL
ncbi:UNVERIFIED_CONTAM: hypothetical protein GTU68_012269, partial [Idotea baltica]|nr:hypothetical protein [Idotea baltica]